MIPAFNEARRLRDSLACIARHLETKAYRAEIIVVDDGSTDETSSIARNVAQTISVPLRLLRYETNRVKGFALKVGFSRASGEIILFSDADLSTPIEEADRILDQLEQDGDVVIGSRKMRGSEIIVRQPWLRERLGRIFTLIVRTVLVEVSDITCGFKAFRGAAGREIFASLRISDWSFDAELLFLAVKRGYRIREVPVRWVNHVGTKVRVGRAAIDSLVGLARIRWYFASGLYDLRTEISEEVDDWRSPSHAELDVKIKE